MACAAPATGISFVRGETFGLGNNHWFLFVVVSCFMVSLLWTFFYLLQVRDFIRVRHTIVTPTESFMWSIPFRSNSPSNSWWWR